MTTKNNVVSLLNQPKPTMAGDKPIFYTVPQILARYSTFSKQGWTERDFDRCLDADLIIGKWREEKPIVAEAEKESLETFLAFYERRLTAAPTDHDSQYYSVAQLIERYPTLCDRGWMEEEMEFFASKIFFDSRMSTVDLPHLEVEQESFLAFLRYHNDHLYSRVKRVEAGLEKIKRHESKGRE